MYVLCADTCDNRAYGISALTLTMQQCSALESLVPVSGMLTSPLAPQAALDYRADVSLYEACQEDANKQCADVEAGGGRIQACLVRPCPVLG
jgi:hypothetical protein